MSDQGNSYRTAVYDPVKNPAESLVILSGNLGAHQRKGIQPDRFRVRVGGWYDVRFSTWGLRWNRGVAEAAKRSVIRQHITLGDPAVKDEKENWKFTELEEPKRREYEENTDFYGDSEATHVVRASLHGEAIGFFDAPSLQPTEHQFRVWLEPGEKFSFHTMSLPERGPANWGSARGVRDYEGPAVAIDWFEIEGPVIDDWPPASHQRLFGNGSESVSELLRDFADAAFRRPVERDEITLYETIADAEIAAGKSREEALVAGYKAILCSPDFLFLGLEEDSALASRLSYFLWNSPPDRRLRSLAESGDLSNEETLMAEADRLMDDPRFGRFIEHFLDEWLELKEIDFTSPDPELYPEFDSWLRESMLEETRRYFRKLVDENRSIDHLVDSDFIMINQRLAELYGIRGVDGSQLRAVTLPPESPRGGFIGQAAILKVTANGTATSPVLRGVWLNERIRGIHTAPPPPNIPAVEPDATGAETIREMIEAHRADAACAGCHDVMDPPGLALESFDPIGGFRDLYRANGRPGKVKTPEGKKIDEPRISVFTARGTRKEIRLGGEVDASGELPDGRDFSDLNGLRDLLLTDRESLARNFVRQLAIYATGTGYRFSDRAGIDAIVEAGHEGNFGIRSLIDGVIRSDIFNDSAPPEL